MFRRQPTNCEPIRRGFDIRYVLRAVVFLACVAGMVWLSLRIGATDDALAMDVTVAQGVFGGAVIGLGAAAAIPGPRPERRDRDR